MLETERKLFDEKRNENIAQHLGKFVLIKWNQVVGFYNTIEEALSEGARRFGLQPFLVRQIVEGNVKQIDIPALTLGILRADSTRSI